MASTQSNILLCASTTLSIVSICLFVVSSYYFNSVINVQREQLLLLTDQQNELKNEVTTLKGEVEQDTTVSYTISHPARAFFGYCKQFPFGII